MASVGGVAHGRDDPVKAWLRSNIPHVVRTGRSKTSAASTLRLILTAEGIPGLFRGNGASCLRIVPYAAIHFSVYEAYRRLLVEHFMPHSSPHPSTPPPSTPPPPPPKSRGTGRDAPPPSTPPAPVAAAGAGAAGSSSGNAMQGVGPSGRPELAAIDDVRPGVTAPAATATPQPASHQHHHQHHPHQHLGEDVPPTPLSSSIEVSATAVITTVEEEQREEAEEELAAAAPAGPPPAAAGAHQEPSDHRRRRPGPALDLVAGSAAGATAVLMTYPLDMVRTRLAWAMDGASQRGPATVTGAEATRSVAPAAAAAGTPAAAGAKGAAVTATAAHHSRIVPMLVHTARHEGVVGLYRGLAPTLYGIMPYAGLKFFVYGSLKQWYRDSIQPAALAAAAAAGIGAGGGGGGGERLPVPYMLAFGGLSGLLAQTVTYPLDVIRRRMQVHGIQQEAAAAAAGDVGVAAPPAAGHRQRLTTWGVGATILQQDGIRGLFRGLSLNYVKVVPSTAIGFTVYDMLKSYLGVTGNM
ncbi:hypothetical protein PLESTF_000753600 [Pleodorina starrii]|nr:hypothetical protein PLESTF_000753600 [Pleodorina starrii]